MANYKNKKKVKKFEVGGMSELARRAPSGALTDQRMADMRRAEIAKMMREATPLGKLEKADLAKRNQGKALDMRRMGEAFIDGSRKAKQLQDLPKDSADYQRMVEAQRAAAAQMGVAPITGAFGMKKGGKVKKGYHKMPDGRIMKDSAHKGMKKGGKVSSCSKRADGCAIKGKTKGKMC